MRLKHYRLFVKVPIIGNYCLIGIDLPAEDQTLIQGAVDLINTKFLHGVLTLQVTDTVQ